MTARLTRQPGGPARLRALLDGGQVIVAPGAFDPLSARLVEEAGFPAVYMTGFGTSAALLGRPDVGLLTMTEMAGNAGRIAACVDIPVIADADTGYGNPLNVIRTVGAYEAAVGFGLSTDGWHEFVKDDPPLAMGAATGIDRLIVFGGGYPIKVGEAVVGAIGVSGGHYSQDMEVAQAGLYALDAS